MSAPSTTPSPAPPVRGVLWHFTDLHFPPDRLDGERKAEISGDFTFQHEEPFAGLIGYARGQTDLRADFLVFSGDFVQGSAVSENGKGKKKAGTPLPEPEPAPPPGPSRRRRALDQATALMRHLAQAHGLDGRLHDRVIVCPGNHDVDWAVAEVELGSSLSEFRDAVKEFVRPDGTPPFAEGNGACILTLDTTPLGGALFGLKERLLSRQQRREVQLDAGAYVPGLVETALASLNGTRPHAARLQRGEVLGFVVAHHPPTVTPTAEIEVKPFEIAIGAAQAKDKLSRKGFRVFLHGHKHMAVAQQEAVFPANRTPTEGVLVLGAAPFLGAGGDERGFNVIEYVVSPASGEARVRLHPHTFVQSTPRALDPRLFYIPPRNLAPAAVLRITERISAIGDSRADYEYLQIPVPAGQEAWGGWRLENDRWIRDFDRAEVSDLDVAYKPLARGFQEAVHARADIDRIYMGKANRTYKVRVEVERNPDVTEASFVERLFTHGAYAVSRSHQRRVSGDGSVVPDSKPGWEGVMHTMADPARRLEFCICMPFPLEHDYPVQVHTYRCGEGGEWESDPFLLRFSPQHVSKNFAAKRLCVSIDYPLVGVRYVVRWKLPEDDPSVGEGASADENYGQDLGWAERFRCTMLAHRGQPGSAVGRKLREVIEEQIDLLIGASTGVTREEIEWEFFVPDRDVRPYGFDDGGAPLKRPSLVPVFASYPPDARWISRLAGEGVVGRAYALNKQFEVVGPRSARYSVRKRNEWIDPHIEVYQPLKGFTDHAVLYGLPVHVPGRGQSDILWGVFCIGSRREPSRLDLGVPVHIPRHVDPQQPVKPASHAFQAALTNVFSTWLAEGPSSCTPDAPVSPST